MKVMKVGLKTTAPTNGNSKGQPHNTRGGRSGSIPATTAKERGGGYSRLLSSTSASDDESQVKGSATGTQAHAGSGERVTIVEDRTAKRSAQDNIVVPRSQRSRSDQQKRYFPDYARAHLYSEPKPNSSSSPAETPPQWNATTPNPNESQNANEGGNADEPAVHDTTACAMCIVSACRLCQRHTYVPASTESSDPASTECGYTLKKINLDPASRQQETLGEEEINERL